MKHLLFSKLRGVMHTQPIIAELHAGQELFFVREPSNPYDCNCIAVNSTAGRVGYIARELAVTLAPIIDDGTHLRCFVSAITGGGEGQYYGVNIEVYIAKKEGD